MEKQVAGVHSGAVHLRSVEFSHNQSFCGFEDAFFIQGARLRSLLR